MLTERQIPLDKLRSMKGSHIKVMIGLYRYADAFGLCWPGLRTLAADLNCSVRAVRRSLDELVALEHLVIEKQPRGVSTKYRVAAHLLGSIRRLKSESPHESAPEKDARQIEFFYLFKKPHHPRKPITTETRTRVLQKGNGCCWYCGWKLDPSEFDVDHVVPVVMGGSDELENLAPSCRLCNGHKASDELEQFRTKIQRLSGNAERHLFFFERDPDLEESEEECAGSVSSSRTEGEAEEVEEDYKKEEVLVGRDAPLKDATLASVVKIADSPTMKAKKKEQRRQKVLRFILATCTGEDLERRLNGMMGEDPTRDEQWWFDKCDAERILAGWDDVRDKTGPSGWQRLA